MPEGWWKYFPPEKGKGGRELAEFPKNGIVFSDLHIHSNKNGNVSKEGDVSRLVSEAKRKGIGLLGTGDLTNVRWRKIVYSETSESDGLQYFGDFPLALSVEVSCSDKAHHLILIPDRGCADALFSEFSKAGKIEKMGRPFLHFNSEALVRTCIGIDEKIEVIPAHVWTPHYGLFGEEAHYNSLSEAFGDFAGKISAIETGLSSDPEMNRRMDFLNGKTIVSFSDCHAHTLLRLGREATAFPKAKSYSEIVSAIRKNKVLGTIEVFPEFGKYHLSGHRKCGVSLNPKEETDLKGICPKCNKSLTIGVESRVFSLQKRGRGKPDFPEVKTLPIPEIASAILGVGAGSGKVRKIQDSFIEKFGSEIEALVYAPESELKAVEPKVGKAIYDCRQGRVSIVPGFDGVYGKISFG